MPGGLWNSGSALAETVAQVGVYGFKQVFVGLKFPVSNGYIFLRKGGGYNPAFGGAGLLPEAAGLLHTAVVAGVAVELWFQPNNVR